MNFKNVICLVFLLFILSIATVSAADLDDDFVSGQLEDSSFLQVSDVENLENVNMIIDSEISDSPGTFDDLQFEIDNAPAGSVLNLTKDYNGRYGARINLNKNLIIDGNGHTLDCLGESGCSAFYSANGNIILKNLRIINGHNDYSELGGSIYSIGSSQYTIENCIFENNFANDYGGAIYTENPLTIINCQFNSNKADDDGGAICTLCPSLSIYDSIFKDNYADRYGGAISVDIGTYRSVITINNCQFISNRADSYGGAVHTPFYTLIIENSSFTDNSADIAGGAIISGNSYVTNSFFKSNRVYGTFAKDSYAGAIYASDIVSIENSTFIDNSAEDCGGAVFTHALYINAGQNNSQDYNTFFINNTAKKDRGGAVYLNEHSKFDTDSNIVNTLFSGNTALVDGGAIYSEDFVNFHHCLFDSNTAVGAMSQCYGGAIRSLKDVAVDNSTFNNNYAEDYGGAIYAKIVNVNTLQSNNDSFNSFFFNNKAGDNKGGAIFAEKSVNLVNTLFSGNSALVDGGAVYAEDNVGVIHSYFESNRADGASVSRCWGGAIRAEDNVNIDNSTFKNNYAENSGGAIYADTVSIANTSSFFEGNTAFKAKGGAIYANKFVNDVKYASFIDNSAGKGSSDDGGAIYIFNENHVTFSQNIFINNYCTDEGGAIYLDSSNSHLTLNNNIFINNHANSEGQSVYNCGYYDQINSNFWGDTNPSSNNDQLIEWKFLNKNVHHSDSNPLIMDVKLSNTEPAVHQSTSASVVFLNPDRTSIDGEMYHGNQVSYNTTPIFLSMEYKYDDKNNNYVDLVFGSEGNYFIKADIGGYSVSKEFHVVDFFNNGTDDYSYNPDSLPISLDKYANIRYLVYDAGYLNTDLDNNQSSNPSEANNDVNPSVNKQLDNTYPIFIVILLLLIPLAAVLIKKYKN